MKRLTILCAALTAAMFMNMSVYAGTSEAVSYTHLTLPTKLEV